MEQPMEVKRGAGRPRVTLSGSLGELAAKLGGNAALADALGVTEQTVYRWDRGATQIKKPAAKLLVQLAIMHGVKVPAFAMAATK